jgi:hypothetical protein
MWNLENVIAFAVDSVGLKLTDSEIQILGGEYLSDSKGNEETVKNSALHK